MTARGNWQTVIADLALILFMITAAAIGRPETADKSDPLPLTGEPLSVFRASAESPSLADWLAGQPRDDRQRLTIVAQYSGGDPQPAAANAMALARQVGGDAWPPRVIVEPGDGEDLFAMLAFDGAADWHTDCSGASANGAGNSPAKESKCD